MIRKINLTHAANRERCRRRVVVVGNHQPGRLAPQLGSGIYSEVAQLVSAESGDRDADRLNVLLPLLRGNYNLLQSFSASLLCASGEGQRTTNEHKAA